MSNYEQFREKAIAEFGLCQEYTDILSKKNSNKRLFDLLCSAKGLDYMCDAIAKGWGVSNEELLTRFEPFINGKYIAELEGYNSKLYCEYYDSIIADTTAIGIVNSSCTIVVPQYELVEIYLTGKCDVEIIGDGECVCVCYGNEDNINIKNKCYKMKRINKLKHDDYGV